MKKFLETIINIYNIDELRQRIGVTLFLLLVYRLGAQIVIPGIDSVQLASLAQKTDAGGLLGILNAFTGGAFANASVFALGIMPYISASIVVQLMGIAIPYLQKLQKDLGVTYIFITHDIATVKAISDEIVVMYQGKVVEQGLKSKILNPPYPDYTELLLSSVPKMDPDWLTNLLDKRSTN